MLCLFDIALGFWSQQEEELEQVWQDQEACGTTVEGGVGQSLRAWQWASGLWIVKKSRNFLTTQPSSSCFQVPAWLNTSKY